MVREALLHGGGGKLSLALGYLRRRREKNNPKSFREQDSEDDDQADLSFDEFKQIGYCLVYQMVCHDQVHYMVFFYNVILIIN